MTIVAGQRRDPVARTYAEVSERACQLLRAPKHVGIAVAMDCSAITTDDRPLAKKHGRPSHDRRHRQLVIHVRPRMPPPTDRLVASDIEAGICLSRRL